MPNAVISVVPVGIFTDNYVWVLINKKHQNAVVVDPGEADAIHAFLQHEKLQLAGILVTHHHPDHTNGVKELQSLYDAPVFGPGSDIFSAQVANDDVITIKDFPVGFKVLAIPGHTLDHVAFYSEGMLFCGDTLFSAGCGRLFEGTANQLYDSLQRLATLPADTKVYCGHEYTLSNLRFAQQVEPENNAINKRIKIVSELRGEDLPTLPSTLKEEKETNPFLRCENKEVIAAAERYSGKKLLDPVAVFAALRQWKDGFK